MIFKNSLKWVKKAREILEQLFIVVTVGGLLVFIPLHRSALENNRSEKKAVMQRSTNMTGEVKWISTSRTEDFANWLHSELSSQGPGDTY